MPTFPRATRLLLRTGGLLVGILLATYTLPNWPTFADNGVQQTKAHLKGFASAYEAKAEPDPDGANDEDQRPTAELAQPQVIDRALSKLAPRQPGAANLFALGVAGWSAQGVFAREIAGSLQVLNERFGTGQRTVRLVNSSSPASDALLASPPNLATALRGIAARMDRELDVLVLVLTSHADRSGMGLEFGTGNEPSLTPASLKAALDEAGIKNRIIVVSACHSGVFGPALADENSVVVTASSAETNSFGCSEQRNWTYFGEAFFHRGLREEKTLASAFARTRVLVAEWEAREGLKPSEPQMHVGSAIKALIPNLIGRSRSSERRSRLGSR